MILSSNSNIYKLGKSDSNNLRLNELKNRFTKLNDMMLPLKDKRGRSWLYYNCTSPEAILKRFKLIKKPYIKSIKQESDYYNDEGDLVSPENSGTNNNCEEVELITQEKIDGFEYQHYPLIKEYVDKYISNIVSRKASYMVTDSDNISLAMYSNNILPNYFDNEIFLDNKVSILQDQLIKGLGVCRSRIYDISEKTQKAKFSKNKDGKIEAKFEDYTNKIKNGVHLEYLDVDNLIYNPDDKDVNEFFIINFYTKDEAKQLYPILKDEELNESLKYFVSRYKIHEQIKYMYDNNLDTEKSVSNLFYTGLKKTLTSNRHNYNLHTSLSFNDYIYSDEISKLNQAIQEGSVKIIEYYNIKTRKYSVYCDDYLLYDGVMLEPFDHSPLTLFRYKSVGSSDMNTESLASELMIDQKKLNSIENDLYKAHKMSLVNIIEVCEEKLPNKDEEINLEVATMIKTNVGNYLNTTGGTGIDEGTLSKIPLITQNPIQISGLQISTDIFNRIISFIERRFPNIQNINNQMPRELVQDVLYTAHLDLNRVIEINQAKYSEVCRKLLILNMFYEYYNNNAGFIGKLEDKKFAIYFVFEQSEIVQKKLELMKLIEDTNNFNYEQTKKKLLSNPAFESVLIKSQEKALEQLNKFNAEQNKNGLTADPEAMKKASEAYIKGIRDKLITEQVVINTPKISTDNIMIVALENYMDLYDNQKLIKFSYKETQSEVMNKLIKSSEMIKSFGLAYNFDASLIMDMISQATGIGKNLYVPYEQTQMAQSKAIEMTRVSAVVQDPVGLSAVLNKLNIQHDPIAMNKYYKEKNILMHEAQRDVALIKQGLVSEALLSELDKEELGKQMAIKDSGLPQNEVNALLSQAEQDNQTVESQPIVEDNLIQQELITQ